MSAAPAQLRAIGRVAQHNDAGGCWLRTGPSLTKGRSGSSNGHSSYLGTPPSMPSTYQLSELKVAAGIALPAATISLPVLSLSGPANGLSSPEISLAFLSSKTLTAAGGMSGLSGGITTSPSFKPQRVWRFPVHEPSSTFLVSAM